MRVSSVVLVAANFPEVSVHGLFAELWGEQMEQELTGALDAMTERGAASSLLALLPKDFTTADLIRLRARKNQSVTPTSVNSLLCRWRKLGRIDKTADAHWRRLT